MQQVSIRNQINKKLDMMSVDSQEKVLDFINQMSNTRIYSKKDGEKLEKLAGILTAEEAEELIKH